MASLLVIKDDSVTGKITIIKSKGGKTMTLQGKHGGIHSGIKSGQTNAALAKQHGVSRGMIQKHRSGETASGNFPSGVTIHGRTQEEAEWEERRQKMEEWFSENEMICLCCGITTYCGTCQSCGQNIVHGQQKKLPEPAKCPWCDTTSDYAICPIHGDYPYL